MWMPGLDFTASVLQLRTDEIVSAMSALIWLTERAHTIYTRSRAGNDPHDRWVYNGVQTCHWVWQLWLQTCWRNDAHDLFGFLFLLPMCGSNWSWVATLPYLAIKPHAEGKFANIFTMSPWICLAAVGSQLLIPPHPATSNALGRNVIFSPRISVISCWTLELMPGCNPMLQWCRKMNPWNHSSEPLNDIEWDATAASSQVGVGHF